MVNLLDLRHYLNCKKQVQELAEDPDYAVMIRDWLDQHPDIRGELPDVYVRAVQTIEKMRKL